MYKQCDGISFNTYLMVAVGKENYYHSNPNRMQMNQQNSWDNNFSGWVMFFDWNENFVNGYELENGHIVKVSQKEKKNEVARTESSQQNVCEQVWVHLGWDCYYDNPDDPIYTPPPSQSPPTQSPPPTPPQDPSIPIPTRTLERQIPLVVGLLTNLKRSEFCSWCRYAKTPRTARRAKNRVGRIAIRPTSIHQNFQGWAITNEAYAIT